MNAATTQKKINKIEAMCNDAYKAYRGEQQKRRWGHLNNMVETYEKWRRLLSVQTALKGLQQSQNTLDYELKRTKIKL